MKTNARSHSEISLIAMFPSAAILVFGFLGIKKGLSLVTESRGCRPKLDETSASEMQSAHSLAK
jgi:hypothetical protein